MAADPPAADRYWLLVAGEAAGPFPPAQVRAMLAAGAVTLGTEVCAEGGTEWQPLHHVPGLTSAAIPPAPAVGAAQPSPSHRSPAPAAETVPPRPARPRPVDPGRPPDPSRVGRRALLGAAAVAAVGVGYAGLRAWLPAALAGYDGGSPTPFCGTPTGPTTGPSGPG